MARTDWDDEELERQLRAKMSRNMDAAMQFLVGRVQKKINRGNARGKNPSLPGTPPKKVSARLFQSLITDVEMDSNSVTGKVGTNVPYARRLEFGFIGTDSLGRNVSQGARPYLRPALAENTAKIIRILGRD
jgi:phage gpG-like protein